MRASARGWAAQRPLSWVAMALLLLAAGCGRHRPEGPGAPVSLRVAVRAAPRQAGDPAVGPVDTIRVDLHEPESAVPQTARVAIAPGQTEFSVALAAAPGTDRSLSVMALGRRTVLGGPGNPEPASGILYFARADSVDIRAGDVTTVPVVLRLFVPVIQPPEVAPGGTSYTIRWNRIPGADEYRVTRILASGVHAYSPATDTIFTGEMLPVHCQVTAVAHDRIPGAPSDYVHVSRHLPPVAPSSLAVATVSTTALDLTWSDNSGDETGFELQRRLPPGDFAVLAAPAADAARYGDTGLQPNTAYGYRLRAVNAEGASDWTAEATGTTRAGPPRLTATPVSPHRIDLAWSADGTATLSFEIERRVPPGAFAPLGTPGATATAWADSGLVENTTYEYRIRAVNAAGPSDYSDAASATTAIGIPAAPGDFTATAASPNRVNLAWADNATNETGYEVQRRDLPAGAFGTIASLPAGSTTAGDPTVLDNRSYRYRVRAFNSAGNSAWSNEAQVTTPLAPPGAPGHLGAAPVSSSEIRLTWTSSSGAVDFYDVYRQLSLVRAGRRFGPAAFDLVASVAAPDTTFLDARLLEMTAYDYQVIARNAAGSSGPSNIASATTLLDPPTPPSNLQITLLGSDRINLQWLDNSVNEATFDIQRAEGAGAFLPLASLPAGATTYSDTTVAGSTPYAYRVRAVNMAAPSAWSNEVSGTTPPGLPGAPWGLIATAVSRSEIQLAWHRGSGVVDSYDILRGSPGGPVGFAAAVPASDTTWLDASLPENSTFQYEVRARNTTGTSPPSKPATATTLLNPPAAPTGLFVSGISSTEIDLVWTDRSSNEDGFEIDKTVVAAAASSDTVGPNIHSYADHGPIIAGGTHHYKVRAFNAAGVSAWSNEVSAYVPFPAPGIPTGLIATPIATDAIRLSWTPGSGYVSQYDVWRHMLPAGPDAYISVSGFVTSYDNVLLPPAAYEYVIRAVNPDGSSGWSAPASASLLVPPAAPTNMDAAYSAAGIDVYWSDNASNEDNYELERRVVADPFFTPVATLPANTQYYRDNTLNCGYFYVYRVRAVNAAGPSAYSGESPSVTIGACAEQGGGGRQGK